MLMERQLSLTSWPSIEDSKRSNANKLPNKLQSNSRF